ncbi:hypothetical protein BH11ACT3_BH11ACT3_15040 [soil metagenome]
MEPLRPISYVRELRQWDEDDRPLRRAVRSGQAVRIHRGAFMSLKDWGALTREQRHRHQAVAATRAGRSRPTLSHLSAAIVWGAPTVDPLPRVVDVLSTPATGTRTEGGYRRHATTRPDVDVCLLGDVPITGFVRTMAEYAAQANFVDAVVALDWAFRAAREGESKPSTTPTQVLRVAEELDIQRGRRKLLRAVSFADPKSGSPGESASRVGMHVSGFPPPELQVEFRDHDGLVGFSDFWWPDFGLVGEFDGLVKYTDQRFTKGQSIDEIVIAEKKREDRLRALPRVHGVSRWLWAEALFSHQLATTLIRAGLPRARR